MGPRPGDRPGRHPEGRRLLRRRGLHGLRLEPSDRGLCSPQRRVARRSCEGRSRASRRPRAGHCGRPERGGPSEAGHVGLVAGGHRPVDRRPSPGSVPPGPAGPDRSRGDGGRTDRRRVRRRGGARRGPGDAGAGVPGPGAGGDRRAPGRPDPSWRGEGGRDRAAAGGPGRAGLRRGRGRPGPAVAGPRPRGHSRHPNRAGTRHRPGPGARGGGPAPGGRGGPVDGLPAGATGASRRGQAGRILAPGRPGPMGRRRGHRDAGCRHGGGAPAPPPRPGRPGWRWPRWVAGAVLGLGAHAAAWWVFWLAFEGEAPSWRAFAPDLLGATVAVAGEVAILVAALRVEGLQRREVPAAGTALGVASSAIVAAAYTGSVPVLAMVVILPSAAVAAAVLASPGRPDLRGFLPLAAADVVVIAVLIVAQGRGETAGLGPSPGASAFLLLAAAAIKVGAVPGLGTWRLAAGSGPGGLGAVTPRAPGIAFAGTRGP